MLAAAPWAFSIDAGEGNALDVERLTEMLAEQNHATFAVDGHAGTTRDARAVPAGAELIGTASITRARQQKFAHRARLWGVFVEPTQRKRGLGKALICASVEQARSWGVEFVDLSVSARSPEAERLYRAVGFTPWGREPGATAWNRERYDEIHMALRL
jgi:GNAT superfamily N-acetyltransferase